MTGSVRLVFIIYWAVMGDAVVGIELSYFFFHYVYLHGRGLFVFSIGAVPYITNTVFIAISYCIHMKTGLTGKTREL